MINHNAGLIGSFFVPIRPRTKGSLKVVTPRGRKPILIEDHEHSKPCRNAVAKVIRTELIKTFGMPLTAWPGPVEVLLSFIFDQDGPTAQTLPFPTVNAGVNANGDLDKLVRNVLDALKDSSLLADDSMVVRLTTEKRWALPEAEDTRGIMIRVTKAHMHYVPKCLCAECMTGTDQQGA